MKSFALFLACIGLLSVCSSTVLPVVKANTDGLEPVMNAESASSNSSSTTTNKTVLPKNNNSAPKPNHHHHVGVVEGPGPSSFGSEHDNGTNPRSAMANDKKNFSSDFPVVQTKEDEALHEAISNKTPSGHDWIAPNPSTNGNDNDMVDVPPHPQDEDTITLPKNDGHDNSNNKLTGATLDQEIIDDNDSNEFGICLVDNHDDDENPATLFDPSPEMCLEEYLPSSTSKTSTPDQSTVIPDSTLDKDTVIPASSSSFPTQGNNNLGKRAMSSNYTHNQSVTTSNSAHNQSATTSNSTHYQGAVTLASSGPTRGNYSYEGKMQYENSNSSIPGAHDSIVQSEKGVRAHNDSTYSSFETKKQSFFVSHLDGDHGNVTTNKTISPSTFSHNITVVESAGHTTTLDWFLWGNVLAFVLFFGYFFLFSWNDERFANRTRWGRMVGARRYTRAELAAQGEGSVWRLFLQGRVVRVFLAIWVFFNVCLVSKAFFGLQGPQPVPSSTDVALWNPHHHVDGNPNDFPGLPAHVVRNQLACLDQWVPLCNPEVTVPEDRDYLYYLLYAETVPGLPTTNGSEHKPLPPNPPAPTPPAPTPPAPTPPTPTPPYFKQFVWYFSILAALAALAAATYYHFQMMNEEEDADEEEDSWFDADTTSVSSEEEEEVDDDSWHDTSSTQQVKRRPTMKKIRKSVKKPFKWFKKRAVNARRHAVNARRHAVNARRHWAVDN